MAYTTTTAVQALVPKWTLSTTSKPTLVQVGLFIDDVDAEINVALAGQGVSTPYATAGAFLTWLGKLSADGATARTLKAMFPDASGPMETPAYKFFADSYRDGLKMIASGAMVPPAAGASGPEIQPHSYATRNGDTEVDDGVLGTAVFRAQDMGAGSDKY